MLASSAVDRGFIGGVLVSVLASSAVDRGFIGGVLVSVLALECGRSWESSVVYWLACSPRVW